MPALLSFVLGPHVSLVALSVAVAALVLAEFQRRGRRRCEEQMVLVQAEVSTLRKTVENPEERVREMREQMDILAAQTQRFCDRAVSIIDHERGRVEELLRALAEERERSARLLKEGIPS